MSPVHQTASFVFTETVNFYSGQDNQAFSILLSLLMPSWTFIGYDASAHVAEETLDSYKQASRGIILSITVSAIGGLAMILALTFSIVDLDSVLGSTYPAPLMQYFLDATNGNAQVATLLMTIIVGANYFAGLSAICANSRMIYAFCRDSALGGPLSKFLYYTSPRTKLPVRTIFFSTFLANCILAIGFGSNQGLQVAASIATIGMMTAYSIPIFCRLTFARTVFKKGEFHLGPFSEVIGWIAVVWTCFLFVLLCLPYSYPVTAANFNYASVLIGGLTFFSGSAWIFNARFWFRGPVPHVSEDEVLVMEQNMAKKTDA
ncbi:hypothetical protein M427DRAFT_34523 [Gonapodya prolifera JEL478]|uniref:Amino acid permease/ SLC12A domain-containing protein n=1 Tax=Gonapodya prolifera (strain JEL478) TaxID=1344416 RepID=A0A139A787_GONPJ|nr:hypothetical protein M427DRAFT_34523 [Gonapodya prolifera JEL478]|eukprot:KXS12682.1 hypothetical protein M427DRAFT_34523 [Gonapodya prolifera JEL478]